MSVQPPEGKLEKLLIQSTILTIKKKFSVLLAVIEITIQITTLLE